MLKWYDHAGGNRHVIDRRAEYVVPADRFAHEIVGFWHTSCGALATAELYRSATEVLNRS
jgi:hypothetical protein